MFAIATLTVSFFVPLAYFAADSAKFGRYITRFSDTNEDTRISQVTVLRAIDGKLVREVPMKKAA